MIVTKWLIERTDLPALWLTNLYGIMRWRGSATDAMQFDTENEAKRAWADALEADAALEEYSERVEVREHQFG